jgi:hypothetical protein
MHEYDELSQRYSLGPGFWKNNAARERFLGTGSFVSSVARFRWATGGFLGCAVVDGIDADEAPEDGAR